MTIEYKNLLQLKSPQNNVASGIVITEKKKAIQTYHICQEWDKVKDFTDEPVAQCDVPAIEITSLDDDDHGDCK